MWFIWGPYIPKWYQIMCWIFKIILKQFLKSLNIKVNYSKPCHKAIDQTFRIQLGSWPPIGHYKILNEQGFKGISPP